MQATKQQIKDSILWFANVYNKLDSYTALIERDKSLIEPVKSIVYDMFIHYFDYTKTGAAQYYYQYIYMFAKELKETGEIKYV